MDDLAARADEALQLGRRAHEAADEARRVAEAIRARVDGLNIALTAEVRVREEAVRRLEGRPHAASALFVNEAPIEAALL
eukprot:CAMPEP_0176159164 /NCGR_PEP_ID=MMETSP0120_2-20121206/81418_1 /TAXON_ID=160619 /ORGANISM="Kryptoperidinium foliaceum, Strain CCMP 1326" /LENGTH=79 /DNA_ID=CAMNT_0017496569 /DNA_START=1 /DNA_END=236 /DNA_ORIENTATION=-